MPTIIRPTELNYDRYSMTKYDRDIVNSIPFHVELHRRIARYVLSHFKQNEHYNVLDLGAGTGLTSQLIQKLLPAPHFDIVDFSKQMLAGAQRKLGKYNVSCICADYAKRKFTKKYDIIISVIGLHHQSHAGKRKMFKKIYSLLKPGGIFIFGDLVTFRDHHVAAYSIAKHFHHLVENATDKKTLIEWAHHHVFLNNLAPLEDQLEWLKECGFKVVYKCNRYNTALVILKK